ncbi:MAG TPA: adenylate/guanylate cyclase domain-containing protein [Burkholderiales bacterium]|nr:adenylate/guanylate cyclase domain-containing protein [Burkholderiales bacterium]
MLFLVGQALGLYPVKFVTQLDNFIYDARLAMTMPRGVESRIVILDIDEQSLGELGHWPWSRNLMAELVDQLFERHGVALLAFDVVWAERDTSSGIDTLDRLARDLPQFRSAYAKLRPNLDFDARFAAAMKGRPVVLGYYFNSEARAVRANAIPKPVLPEGSFSGRMVDFHQWQGYTGNLSAYLESAAGAGHINQLADADGVLRRLPLIVEFEGEYYEAFSLAVFRTLLAKSLGTPPALEPGFKDDALETLKVGPFEIPVDENAATLIPYRGRKFSFEYVPAADVLKERVAPGSLKDKIVLVGATASTLGDLRSTPVDNVLPGVEVHANMLAGMLDQDFKRRPWYTLGAEVVLLLVGGTLLALLIPMLSALWATLAVAAGTALIVAFNVTVWQQGGLVLPLASSLLMVLALYTMNMAYGYFVESRSKRQFAELFGQYVPPELVRQMARDPRRYNMAPRSAELTLLFSDVRGFTGISEALSPEALREYINEYLTTMSEIIRGRHRGTLDKYIGDAVMAFWGAPVEDPQQARNAVLAALDMQKAVGVLNQRFAARGWPRLAIGVGINTGTVRVGDMGSKLRRAYTAMGDAVNVASRLEGCTKHYGAGILVGESTRQRIEDVAFREVDRIKVKGKDEAITIYEPLGLVAELQPQGQEELRIWAQALRAYRSRNWDLAEVNLHNLQRLAPGFMLYAMYADRVRSARASPMTADWEPVTVFDEK